MTLFLLTSHWFMRCPKKAQLPRQISTRLYSQSGDGISNQVFVSQSECIHTNLALEDWLFENGDLENKKYLLLWRNGPAVVIGRHQNPWLECNVPEVLKHDISLARRKSGGGTVYHDRGNMNCSVLAKRKLYDRKSNLKLIVESVQSKWDIPLTVNNRDDVMLDGLYKVSGTAAKLSRNRSYHHFTLLHSADLSQVSSILHSNMVGEDTNATGSVSAPVANINDAERSVNFESLADVIIKQFLKGHESEGHVQKLHPTESMFPGLTEKIQELKNPTWVFGKTPKFSVCREFILTTDSLDATATNSARLKITAFIEKGFISDMDVIFHGIAEKTVVDFIHGIQNYLRGKSLYSREITIAGRKTFTGHVVHECISEIEHVMEAIPHEENKIVDWVINCFHDLFNFS